VAKSKDTGLGGRSNFFKTGGQAADETNERTPRAAQPEASAPSPALAPGSSAAKRPVYRTKPGKIRSSFTVFPETLAAMEEIKALSRRSGNKESFSDILEAAVQALIKERGLKL